MGVSQLLLETLEDLGDDDFTTFKWYLMNRSDSKEKIPVSRLEKARRTGTVSEMLQRYGEERAVNITAEILRTMGKNNDAVKLERAYAGAGAATATSSTSSSAPSPPAAPGPPAALGPPAAPTTMSAQNGSMIFAPMFSDSTVGSVNVTITTPKQ